MHVGALLVFDLPEGASPDYLREQYEAAVSEQNFRAPFNQKLDFPLSRLGVPRWIDDEEFDPGYHLRHAALPAPGRYRELFSLISRLHGTLLDRSRPLWECYLIEGLQGTQFAMYVKAHHGMVDGVAAMRLVQKSLSEDPDARDVRFAWSAERRQEARPQEAPAIDEKGGLGKVVDVISEQLRTLPAVTRAVARSALSLRTPQDARMALPFEAPHSVFNTPVTGARRYVAQSYSLDRIHGIGKSYGATVNDVVLAMCASALRRYMQELGGGVPDKPLIAMVPVSIRPTDAESLGNALTGVLVNLGTHVADPVKRFEVIKTSMADAKTLVKEMTYAEIMFYTALVAGPVMTPSLVGLGAAIPSVNVVISNVPGPNAPLYWNGAKLCGMYPLSILFHGMALNITLASNIDHLDFGIVACRRSLPSVQRIIEFLEEGLVELEQGAKR